ncbi:MAG: transcription-repair coupling factor [Candidatus Glassbacteria bacterium]
MSGLSQLLDLLDDSKPFSRTLESFSRAESKGQRADLRLGNLYGSARNLVAAGIYTGLGRTVLYVTRGSRQAEKIEADLVNFLPEPEVLNYPQWEILPYEEATPEAGIAGQRMEVFLSLLDSRRSLTVASVRSLMQRVSPPEEFCGKVRTLRAGETLDLEGLLAELVGMGFRREAMVEEVGTFSLRGGILDVYGYGMANPVRVELFGDQIEEIRSFEIIDQRSVGRLGEVVLLPVSEFVSWSRTSEGDSPPLSDLLAYLDEKSVVLFDDYEAVLQEAERFREEVEGYYRTAVDRRGSLVRPPAQLYLAPADLAGTFSRFARADLCSLHQQAGERTSIRFETREPPGVNRDLDTLRGRLRADSDAGRRTLIVCDNRGQHDRLEELLGDAAELTELAIGSLETGFVLGDLDLTVFTDHEIFRRFRHLRSRRRYKRAPALESFSSLAEGDFVVHIDYGIGRYRGMKKIATEGISVECLWLEYADGDFLYVPVDQLSLVERYTAEDGAVPAVHKIGGVQWARLKSKTVKAIEDMTDELIEIYANRKVHGGHPFSPDTDWQRDLEDSFVYEETPDQDRAIREIKDDMEAEACMDRLLCGDVGFGKTEVALRAAFKAIQDGKQVAVLVPTTVLAQQHNITFCQRLADFPVAVETLSRFKTPAEQKDILRRLAAGRVDIVIGTHRLLSRDVKFRDLGLLVIDEEQRFGVRQKEKLRKIKSSVDTLAMTATPIPRTLHMSLMGVRDLSLITTPPQDRLPIVTQVCPFGEEIVAEAIHRELARDGQVFFVHNRIGSIYAVFDMLRRMVPMARIGVAHGQMPERELELAMRRFQGREIDVLLSTMIVENGLDFPNANTIIVNRADRFGLSQLYQLRGRVGRSYHRAYAYLLVPPRRLITDEAVKRLCVLEEYTELGSGYEIAMRDLELRGTGNILGSQQHGFINAVGFDTYLKLLQDAIAGLQRQGVEKAPAGQARINLDLPAFLPDDYVPDSKQKLALYRKISRVTDVGELAEMAGELADRFGSLPAEAEGLLAKARLKVFASRLAMEAVFISDSYCKLDFGRQVKYRLAQVSSALEPVSGEKKMLSLEPLAVMIRPASKAVALTQIVAALERMSASPEEYIEEISAPAPARQ